MTAFLFHFAFTATMVWMILHFWLRLPRKDEETRADRIREFIPWAMGGVAVPIGVWMFMNVGLTSWLPPFVSEVDAAKNAGGFWPLAALHYCSPAMSVIGSFWAGLSLLVILFMIHDRTEDRPAFWRSVLVWSFILCPVGAAVMLLSGVVGLGLVLVLWLAPIVHYTLESSIKPTTAPSYAAAIGKLKFGKYSEAEMDIIRELESCENDFDGWMMLAELYAVHFQDFKQAEQTIIEVCDQPHIKPSNVGVALHRLADWYLDLNSDPQGARRCMEAIKKRYPGTHLDRMARLRLKRIPQTADDLADSRKVKPLHLPALHEDPDDSPVLPEPEQAAVAGEAEALSRKLATNPDETAVREDFARALAKLGKLEAAIDQLGLLLDRSDHTPRQRAEWLGLKASWMTHLKGDGPELRSALQAILRECPDSPQAMAAQRRMFQLEEQVRVAKYAGRKTKPKRVIRLNDANSGAPENM